MLSYLKKMPSHTISIRAIESERYKVVDLQRNEVLEEIEESKAFFQVFTVLIVISPVWLSFFLGTC